MGNVETIYPSGEGYVTEVITLEEAIELMKKRAADCDYEFNSRQQIIDNILYCPCTNLTDKPVGKTIEYYKGEN